MGDVRIGFEGSQGQT